MTTCVIAYLLKIDMQLPLYILIIAMGCDVAIMYLLASAIAGKFCNV